jgi:NAD(P)-dependent dehydrogenase (short-subunit alcohol dehydrogenase family)
MMHLRKILFTCLVVTTSHSLAATVNQHRFQHEVVLITGGTSGIGLATAVQFATQGAAHVITCSRQEKNWQTAQTYIKSHLTPSLRNHIEFMPCDIRVESTVKNMIGKIYQKYGRLDVAFNNAGVQTADVSFNGNIEDYQFPSKVTKNGAITYVIGGPQPTNKLTMTKAWRKAHPTQVSGTSRFLENTIATNIIGTFYCLKWEMAYAFSKQPKTVPMSIISNASRNGIIPSPSRPIYGASKAFIISLTRSLSSQAAQRSVAQHRAMVRVNVIAPGPVDTPLEHAAFPGKSYYKAMAGVPMQRTATPEEIAPTILFLADRKTSSYITGDIISIDGGHVASPYLTPPKPPKAK